MKDIRSTYNSLNKPRGAVLDLHGLITHTAWKKVANFLESCYYSDITNCKIICGQGAMSSELGEWIRLNRYTKSYKSSHCGGSYTVKLKRINK
jgi:DNA-nicking Smr family endonuclease